MRGIKLVPGVVGYGKVDGHLVLGVVEQTDLRCQRHDKAYGIVCQLRRHNAIRTDEDELVEDERTGCQILTEAHFYLFTY